jgi:predicted kinase
MHRQGRLQPEHIEHLARKLVDFYRSLPSLKVSPTVYRERCRAHVQDNLRELSAVRHHLPLGVVERVHGFQLQVIALSPETLENRALEGRIVEGHGDLRPEHICLGEQPVVFDCIEFSREFRELDVADELAFLGAECDFLGAGWASTKLLDLYMQDSADRPPRELIDFYKAYRACVRAKVAALRAEQVAGEQRAAAANEAARHLEWADRYAQPWVRPLVIVVGGLPGTGKSTLARALARQFGAELLRTDVVRQRIFSRTGRAAAEEGIYRAESRERVYQELFRQAEAFVDQKVAAVLDGTFSTAELVRQAHRLATDPRTIWLAVECVCAPEVARDRIQSRLAAGGDASEALPEIHDLHRARWEAWPPEPAQVKIDTTGPLASQVAAVVAHLRDCQRHRRDSNSGSA